MAFRLLVEGRSEAAHHWCPREPRRRGPPCMPGRPSSGEAAGPSGAGNPAWRPTFSGPAPVVLLGLGVVLLALRAFASWGATRRAVAPVEARAALGLQDPDGRDGALSTGAVSGSASTPRS